MTLITALIALITLVTPVFCYKLSGGRHGVQYRTAVCMVWWYKIHQRRSPRWSSGYPRMLQLYSTNCLHPGVRIPPWWHFAQQYKKKKRDQLPRASSAGRRESTRVDERRKGPTLLATKRKAFTVHLPYWEGVRIDEPAMWPRISVTTFIGGRGKRKGEDNTTSKLYENFHIYNKQGETEKHTWYDKAGPPHGHAGIAHQCRSLLIARARD